MKAKLSLIVILASVLALWSFPALAKEPEEIWKELSKLKGEKRQNFLYSKAKAEGEVVWYSSKTIQVLNSLRLEFNKLFPGIKLEIWRGSGERVAYRVLTEARAKTFNADVISVSNEYFPTLMKAELIGRYSSPERKFYSNLFKDEKGYWTSSIYILAVMAYNTTLVPKSEAPKRYEEFLDPKWKGNFAIDRNADRAIMGWLKNWGTEKTERFLKGINKNDVAVRRGHTLMTQLLCAGEFKAAIELYAFRVAELKQKGCPVDIVFPDPTPGAGLPLSVAKHSRHPFAARILTDFILSETGQKVLVDHGYLAPRRGIKPLYPEIDPEKRGVRLLLLRPEDTEKLGEKYMELRKRFLLSRNQP